jgi:hypothetical protein
MMRLPSGAVSRLVSNVGAYESSHQPELAHVPQQTRGLVALKRICAIHNRWFLPYGSHKTDCGSTSFVSWLFYERRLQGQRPCRSARRYRNDGLVSPQLAGMKSQRHDTVQFESMSLLVLSSRRIFFRGFEGTTRRGGVSCAGTYDGHEW